MGLFTKKELSEEEIIRGCIKEDRRCQELFYNKFANRMYGVCLRYCLDRDVAHDVHQEAFITVFKKLAQFKFDGPVEAWIRRIMVNASLYYLRHKTDLLRMDDVIETEQELIPANVLDNLAAEDILKLIQQLPDGCRTVFNLYAIEGYQHKEIAVMLNISVGTSKSQLSRARTILQHKVLKSTTIKEEIYAGA